MGDLYVLVQWLRGHPLTAEGLCFVGGVLAVVLYTYIHDHQLLGDRG